MTFLWIITGAALALAFVAWSQARRTAKRLEQLTQMYWELKYQHGELRVRLQQGSPAAAADEVPPDAVPAGSTFIPLTSLKR
jgi:hypothetical protein